MIVKKIKVIYFCDGPAPTEADHIAVDRIAKYRTQVVFRNAQLIVKGEALESCDLVAGHVPALYNEYPRAEEQKGDTIAVPPPGKVVEEVVAPASDPVIPEAIAPVATGSDAAPAPDAAEIEAWSNYSVKACASMVEKKHITKERALLLETAGKKRATLLKQLNAL